MSYQATNAFYPSFCSSSLSLFFSSQIRNSRLYDVRFIPDSFSLSNAFSISQIRGNPILPWLMENLGVENTVRTSGHAEKFVSPSLSLSHRMYEISISRFERDESICVCRELARRNIKFIYPAFK